MINNLKMDCHTVKYIDDATIYHVTSDVNDIFLQEAVKVATSWSDGNEMHLNATKIKEMLI